MTEEVFGPMRAPGPHSDKRTSQDLCLSIVVSSLSLVRQVQTAIAIA